MTRILVIIFSVLLWTFFVLSSILFIIIAFFIWIVTVIPDKRLYLLHGFSSFWGSLYIWLNPLWQVRITGKEHFRKGITYMIVSNHQSMLDILIFYSLFRHYKFVSKSENFRIPIIGWLMRLNDYPEINRGDQESKLLLFRRVKVLLSQKNSILMFPEGTRHPGGYLGPFKEGAFVMALDNNVPVLPIVLEGTARALPKKGFILPGRTSVRVSILEEIPVEPFERKKPVELLQYTRHFMEAEYERLKILAGNTPEQHN
jgi:1-acyl-sn-glycerol-3-phosphate acyltransferase